MLRPFAAYDGPEPYAFVCYAHDDANRVYPEISRLRNAGLNIWYDEGVPPGSEWSETLARRIRDCAVFLYYVTPRSVASEHCRREVGFLLNLGMSRALLPIHLEPTALPDGLALSLSNRQAILKYEYTHGAYEAKLSEAIRLASKDGSRPSGADGRLRIGAWTSGLGRIPRAAAWAIASAMVVALGIFGWLITERSETTQATRIHVASIEDRSQDASLGYLAKGLQDELVHHLARVATYIVQTSDDDSLYRVSGSVAPADEGDLSIALQLSRRDRIVWTRTFSAPPDDRVRSRVAVAEIASESIYTITQFETRLAASTESNDALLAVLRGVALSAGGEGWGEQPSRQSYADQALRLDPSFVAAHTLKAEAYFGAVNSYFGGMAPREGFARARALIEQALKIDPTNIWAMAFDVQIKQIDGDWLGAEAAIRKIVELGPTQPPVAKVAEYLAYCGRIDEALSILERLISATPFPAPLRNLKAHALMLARRYGEATAELDRVLETQPDNPRALMLKASIADARGQFGEMASLNLGMFKGAQTREDVGHRWLQLAQAAERGEAPVLPEKIWRPYVWGHAHLGNSTEAVNWMATGWEHGDRLEFWAMRSYPETGFDEMRATSQYRDLVERTIGDPSTCPGFAEFR